MEPKPVTRQYQNPAAAARPAPPRPSERVIRAERRVERARREQRRLAYLRRRRRLRYDDVVVVEEAALRRAILGSVVGNIMEWYDVGVYAYVVIFIGPAFLPGASDTAQNLFSLAVFAAPSWPGPWGASSWASSGTAWGARRSSPSPS